MNIDHHLRTLIGDLLFRIAQLMAENDALRAQLAAATPSPPQEPPS